MKNPFRPEPEPEPERPWFPENLIVTSAPPGVEPLGLQWDESTMTWRDRASEARERLRVQHSESEAAARAAQRHSGDHERRPPDEDVYFTGTGWHSAREEEAELTRIASLEAQASHREEERRAGNMDGYEPSRPRDLGWAANLQGQRTRNE